MRKKYAYWTILILVLSLLVPAALAANPHFIYASAAVDGANLVVSWKEAGLGNNQNIDYEATADASATWACINGGGNHPKAKNKEEVAGPVSAEGTFNSGQNGQITESLTVGPPGPTLECPNGQTLVLACVEYTNVAITDLTNGITEMIAGTYSGGDYPQFCMN
jgi:hypothetical protein